MAADIQEIVGKRGNIDGVEGCVTASRGRRKLSPDPACLLQTTKVDNLPQQQGLGNIETDLVYCKWWLWVVSIFLESMATLWLKDLVAVLSDLLVFVFYHGKALQTPYDVLLDYWCLCYRATSAVKVPVLALSTLAGVLSIAKHKFVDQERISSNWILADICLDYMLKDEKHLTINNNEVFRPRDLCSDTKLVEKLQKELFSDYISQLTEMEQFRTHALFRDERVDDQARIFSLLSTISGLEPIKRVMVCWHKFATTRKYIGFMTYVSSCFDGYFSFYEIFKGAVVKVAKITSSRDTYCLAESDLEQIVHRFISHKIGNKEREGNMRTQPKMVVTGFTAIKRNISNFEEYTVTESSNRWHEELQGRTRMNLLLACRDSTTRSEERLVYAKYQDAVMEPMLVVMAKSSFRNEGSRFVFDRGKSIRKMVVTGSNREDSDQKLVCP